MNPTGSSIERAMRCPASCALASAGYTSFAAIGGTANHTAIENGDRSKRVVRDIMDGATDVRHEVAYALNVETRSVREIGVSISRNYGSLADTEIALTVDLEAKRDGVFWAIDWKSRERVTPAPENWQVRATVMAIMGRHGASAAYGAIAYLDDSELDVAHFDAFHVMGYWADLAWLLKRIREAHALVKRGEAPNVTAGPWCKYCPALPNCPAHTRLAKSLLGELDSVDAQVSSLTVEQCGRAWELLKRYDVIAERVKEGIRARASRETVPLSSGRRLMLVEQSRRSLDTKKAAEMLGDEAPYKTSFFTQVREVAAKEKEDV